tara:strand:+ start:190 stop:1353 length:1164 start_codon:yes stop_codon:yes gene_type:complete
MSTIKVDTVKNRSSAINLPNNFKIGGLSIIQGYTSSGSEPGSPSTGDFWWDSSNDKLYRYIDGGFKELSIAADSVPLFMGTRGVFMGGSVSNSASNVVQYVTIASPGNATDFGDLPINQMYHAGHSSRTRGICAGGYAGSGSYINNVNYITIGTAGNGADFGDLSEARAFLAGGGDDTRTLFGGGNATGNTGAPNNRVENRTIDYFTTANTGNATDFGDLSYWRDYLTATADATRTVFAGGEDYGPSGSSNVVRDTMEYVTTQTTSNVTDFGNLTVARYAPNSGVIADLTRGLFMGGYGTGYSNVIDYITIQTTGNATDFGDMLETNVTPGTCSDGITGIIGGGSLGGSAIGVNSIQKVTIQTTGNATDFGDLTTGNLEYPTACSGQ